MFKNVILRPVKIQRIQGFRISKLAELLKMATGMAKAYKSAVIKIVIPIELESLINNIFYYSLVGWLVNWLWLVCNRILGL